MKTLDDAVIELNGIWPEGAEVLLTTGDEWCGDVEFSGRIIAGDKPYSDYGYAFMDRSIQGYAIIGSSAWIVLCRMNEFQQRAKERGFINGYRWGVEYKTDGKRPDLPDDVIVGTDETHYTDDAVDAWAWHNIKSFKITDERYKPADTSYLEKPALEPVPEEECWWDYDKEKMLSNPPVDLICEAYSFKREKWVKAKILNAETGIKEMAVVMLADDGHWFDLFWCRKFRPADHAERKAKAERKRFIDSGCNITDNLRGVFTSDKAAHDVLCALFNAGFRLPGDSK
jgi:hypothetical protein